MPKWRLEQKAKLTASNQTWKHLSLKKLTLQRLQDHLDRKEIRGLKAKLGLKDLWDIMVKREQQVLGDNLEALVDRFIEQKDQEVKDVKFDEFQQPFTINAAVAAAEAAL